MVHLIDKDALVAEIERLKKELLQRKWQCGRNGLEKIMHQISILNKMLSFIDTLEVIEDNLLTEKKNEKELAKAYINIFDKKFGNKLPNLKSKQLAEFKNFINTCEQTFCMKYFDYHAMQGKLFEKLALLWAVWGKEHLTLQVKEVDLNEEIEKCLKQHSMLAVGKKDFTDIAIHFFELGMQQSKNYDNNEE